MSNVVLNKLLELPSFLLSVNWSAVTEIVFMNKEIV